MVLVKIIIIFATRYEALLSLINLLKCVCVCVLTLKTPSAQRAVGLKT